VVVVRISCPSLTTVACTIISRKKTLFIGDGGDQEPWWLHNNKDGSSALC